MLIKLINIKSVCYAERKISVEWFCLINIVKARIFITWDYNLNSWTKFDLMMLAATEFTRESIKHTKKKKKICGFPPQ